MRKLFARATDQLEIEPVKKIYEFTSAVEFLKASFENSKRGVPALTIERYAKSLNIVAFYNRNLRRQKRDLKLLSVNTSQKELLADPLALPLLVYMLESGNKAPQFIENPDVELIAAQFATDMPRIRHLLAKIRGSGLLR